MQQCYLIKLFPTLFKILKTVSLSIITPNAITLHKRTLLKTTYFVFQHLIHQSLIKISKRIQYKDVGTQIPIFFYKI